jgi:hypothetical protein
MIPRPAAGRGENTYTDILTPKRKAIDPQQLAGDKLTVQTVLAAHLSYN